MNTGQYFEKRKWSQDDMLNLHQMFTDKDTIQDHDGNDYLQVGFQIISGFSLAAHSVLWLASINLKTFLSFSMITLCDFEHKNQTRLQVQLLRL